MSEVTPGSNNPSPAESNKSLLSFRAETSPAFDPQAEWEPGKTILDEYVVRRRLGRGGMGVVYLVEKNITEGVIQFAVKTLHPFLFSKSGPNQSLLRELRTWMSLPPHPNIVACRFFRTMGNRMAIFSEYVDGGSLTEWIAGDRIRSLDQILDIAIQMAWALQAVHDRNVIHQDVKPSNILMTQDGFAKLTDFGISNARRNDASSTEPLQPGQQSILVSTRGCTPAYCSPEQAVRHKVTRHTDMWSWAVTVIQMFTGEVKWSLGAVVPAYLETIAQEKDSSLRFPIPTALHRILTRCLQEKPRDRWKTMADVATRLVSIFEETTGFTYDRNPPEGAVQTGQTHQPLKRITTTGWKWSDPEQWRMKAHQALEIPYTAVADRESRTRKEMLLDDLEILEDAIALYRRLPEEESERYLDDMIAVITDKSVLLTELNDIPGAIIHYEQAIDWITFQGILPEPRKTIVLLELYKGKADTLLITRNLSEAVKIYELIRSVFQERPDIPDNLRMLSLRIRSSANLAYALHLQGKNNRALTLNSELMKEMTTPEYHERVSVANVELGTLHLNQGLVYWYLKRSSDALKEYDAAIALQRTRDYHDKAPDSSSDLARTLSNKALLLQSIGRFEEAECHYLEAVLLMEKLLLEGNRSGLGGVLGTIYTNFASMYAERDDLHLGLKYVKKAKSLLKQNVYLEGIREYEDQISRVLICEAVCLAGLGQTEKAVKLARQAVAQLERLVYEFNRDNLREELAHRFVVQAKIMESAGYLPDASESAHQAILLCQSLMEESDDCDMQNTLLTSRCINARIALRSGAEHAVENIKNLIPLLEQEFEKTHYIDIKRQLDFMRQALEDSSSER